ncbi:MAG: EAL domain-containing protein, partial [Acidobacteria bacterium]|nr:EAL domain-containing protein [Acidobacteriota bacterium]
YTLADGEQLARHGWSQDMFEDKTLWEVFPEDVSAEWEGYYKRALNGETVVIDMDNEEGSYQVNVLPIKDETGHVFAGMVIWQDISERKLAENALKESEARYRQLFENANDIIYVHDLDGNYISINQAAERIFGYSHEEALSLNMADITAPEHMDLVRQMLESKVKGEQGQTVYEIECVKRDGSRVNLEVNSSVIHKDGIPIAIQGVARDVTGRKLADDAIRKSEERYRDLFENANDLIYTHDLEGNFTSLNRAGEMITGYSREEALSLNLADVVAPEYLESAKTMTARKMAGEGPTTYQLDIIAKEGHRVTLDLSTRIMVADGLPVGVQGIARDITERTRAEEKLRHYALHDTLTELPNRVQFMNHLKQAIDRAEGNEYAKFAVLFLDLDRFKVINDSLGHAVGDKLLIAIAERLTACIRPGDVVARLGGDEFTILLNRSGDVNEVVRVAERLQQKISEPFKIDNYEVFTSASIGIIVANDVSRSPEDFLRDADAAMYRAKEAGKARYEIFDTEMHVRNMNLLQIETDLRHAVERNEFEVLYQPIVDLRTGAVDEFEALIRWRHPRHGLIAPNEFVGVAEETGLIVPIGKWILEESALQVGDWQRKFSRPLSVSVNLSAKQLMHPTLMPCVTEILFESGLNANQLKLEVTESTVMEHSEKSLKVLSELDHLGITLSTDDFGTGYSSLSYLQKFPFERLKIDRSFIRIMDEDEKSQAIVKTILMLGENLGIEVVAEGIETIPQFEKLRALGCTTGQGYLFSRPIDRESAEALLETGANMFAQNPALQFNSSAAVIEAPDIH